MVALAELQLGFAEAILSGRDEAVADHLRANGATAARRLAVYRHNTLANQRGALRESYPIIDKLVGGAFFDHLAHAYIAAHSSVSGDLNDYGAGFAAFLSDCAEIGLLPYLSDVARLEWALERAYYAADHGLLEARRLADVPPDRYGDLRLFLHPAAALIQSKFPLYAIWQVHQPDYRGDGHVDLTAGGAMLLVTRRGLQTVIEPLQRAELIFLALLQEGSPFAVAVAAAFEIDEQFPLQERLMHRVVTGDIVGFALDHVRA